MTTDLERKPARGSRAGGGKTVDEPGSGSAAKTPARKRAAPSAAQGEQAGPDQVHAGEAQSGKAEPGKAQPGKAQPAKANANAQPKPGDMPLWERIVGTIGALLVLTVLGFLVYAGVQPASAPDLALHVAAPVPQAHGYLVTVDATNTGATTAAGVTVEGSLTDPAQPNAEPVETSQFTLNYVPDHSTRSGGLEKAFIEWAQADSSVDAFCKISENRHTFARLRYVKEDGLPAFYSPDFMVRANGCVYLTETKAQQQTIHPNVQRKLKAASAWCERNNAATEEMDGALTWHYVMLGEDAFRDWRTKGARLSELLDYARVRPAATAEAQQRLI